MDQVIFDPRSGPFNLTTNQLRRLWRSETFRAIVKERHPYLYCAVKLFGEPTAISEHASNRESALGLIRFVLDSSPPNLSPSEKKAMEKTTQTVDELANDMTAEELKQAVNELVNDIKAGNWPVKDARD